jgi:hypothetical protein
MRRKLTVRICTCVPVLCRRPPPLAAVPPQPCEARFHCCCESFGGSWQPMDKATGCSAPGGCEVRSRCRLLYQGLCCGAGSADVSMRACSPCSQQRTCAKQHHCIVNHAAQCCNINQGLLYTQQSGGSCTERPSGGSYTERPSGGSCTERQLGTKHAL